MGREKGFEMWEELGFYEGFAKLWRAIAERGKSDTDTNNKQDKCVLTSTLLPCRCLHDMNYLSTNSLCIYMQFYI